MGTHTVCKSDELAAGQPRLVEADGIKIGFFNVDGQLYAIEDRCSHDDGPLAEGEFDPDTESADAAARREFAEELGRPVPEPPAGPGGRDAVRALTPFKAGHKTIHAMMQPGDFAADRIESNTVDIEWPPRSARIITVPEVDRAAWFTLSEARTRLHKGQVRLVDLIAAVLTT